MVSEGDDEIARAIAGCALNACIIEASAEKPGNVTPTKRFEDTSYGDYIAASRALSPVFLAAAETGLALARERKPLKHAGLGKLVLAGVEKARTSHAGGNTHLGIILLYMPLLVAAGHCAGRGKWFGSLQNESESVVKSSTTEDAVELYAAIAFSGAGGLGKTELDVSDPLSKEELRRRGVTFYDAMRSSSGRDDVALELSGGFKKTFEAASLIKKISLGKLDLNKATVQTYLVMLSKYPDTLVARKCGVEAAAEVSKRARETLEFGGILTEEGRKKTGEFDAFLRSNGNKLNPGTTADITAAALLVTLLDSMKS